MEEEFGAERCVRWARKVRSALLQFRVLIITIESSHTYYLGVSTIGP